MGNWQDCYPDDKTVVRYVVTYLPSSGGSAGMRTLAFSAQGRWTYATAEEAEATLQTFSGPEGFPRVMNAAELASLQVRPVKCWRGHFDPCGVYFD